MKRLIGSTGWALALLIMSSVGAQARYVAPQNTPGSILVFPLVDATPGRLTVVSITNTNTNRRFISGMPYREGDVDLLIRYIYEDGSMVENVARMEAGGVHSFFAQSHAGRVHAGYLYVIARDPFTGEAIDFDFLLGHALVLDLQTQAGFGIEAIPFRSLAKENQSPTGLSPLGHVYSDLGKDGEFYLDGTEFSATYDKITVPVLFEEVDGAIETEVVLLTTLPAHYRVDVQLELFNNDENAFQVPFNFQVWKRSTFGGLTDVARMPNLNGGNPTGEIRTGWARFQATHAVDLRTGQAMNAPGIMGCVLTHAPRAHVGYGSGLIGEGSRSGGSLHFLN